MEVQRGLVNKNRVVALGVLILLVLLVLFLIWWWFFRIPAEVSTEPPRRASEDRVILPPQIPTLEPPPIVERQTLSEGELEVITLARNFAERYGSWSTESDFQNLIDLLPQVTPRLENEFRRQIAASSELGAFRGVDTRVINIDISRLADVGAAVTVMTQRVETNTGLGTSVSYQALYITMLKLGGFWYVDTADWED